MVISSWPAPYPEGNESPEQLVRFDQARPCRVLICPAWFDEANKLRRFTVELMRRLDKLGIDSLLPDLPGCNESIHPLEIQTIAGWSSAMIACAGMHRATHVLAIRAGAIIAPATLPGWHYAAQSGPKLLRAMIRARIIAAREAGMTETSDELMTQGRTSGLTLGGWRIGAAMFRELEAAEPVVTSGQCNIVQSQLGGAALWLRAEPAEDAAQVDKLASLIAQSLAEPT